jgi:hypothetical protein
MGAAVEGAIDFYPVADNAAAAVMTGRGQGSDRAFEAIEGMGLPSHDNLKGLIVVVATPLTLGHSSSSLMNQLALGCTCRDAP